VFQQLEGTLQGQDAAVAPVLLRCHRWPSLRRR
jgi:hypothetical protein